MDAAENGAAQHPPRKKRNRTAIVLGAFALISVICCATIAVMWDEPDFNGVRYGTRLPQLEGMEEVVRDLDWTEEEEMNFDPSVYLIRDYRRSGDDNLFWGVPVARIEYSFLYDTFISGFVLTDTPASRERLYEALCERCIRLWWSGDGETNRSGVWFRIPNLYFYAERFTDEPESATLLISNMLNLRKVRSLNERSGGL